MWSLFQSPSGDSLFSDEWNVGGKPVVYEGFNPLAGIRCFLTTIWGVTVQDAQKYVSIP